LIAAYENRFETDVAAVKWMIGTNLLITLAVFVKLFVH